jgi:hypothetical protein
MVAPPVNIQKEAKRCEKTLVSLGKTSTYGVVFYEKHCKKDTDLSDVFSGKIWENPKY